MATVPSRDWAGAGRGPRLWSLAWLLWVAGARSSRLVELIVPRYLRASTPEPAELDRLEAAMRARPLMLECWAFWAGRRELSAAVQRVEEADRIAARVAAQARSLFERGLSR